MNKYLYLTPMLGGPGAPRYPIATDLQLVGRSEHSAIALLEPTVSRKHATIQLQGQNVLLEDLGSKHGTFVNSRRITSAKLKVGDIVVFGLSLVLRLEESDQPICPIDDLKAIPASPTLVGELNSPPIKRIQSGLAEFHMAPTVSPIQTRPTETAASRLSPFAKALTGEEAGRGTQAALLAEMEGQLADLQSTVQNIIANHPQDESLIPLRSLMAAMRATVKKITKALGLRSIKDLEAINLAATIERALTQVAPEFQSHQITFAPEIDPLLMVHGDEYLLLKVFQRLLRNAGKLSLQQGTVTITASSLPPKATLGFCHRGKPYRPDLLEQTGQVSVDQTTEIHGLKEVREIIESFGGKVALDAEANEWITVQLSLLLCSP